MAYRGASYVKSDLICKQMSKLSFLIPSRGERFLVPTVKTILKNCSPDVEVVVCLDGGEWPNPEPLPDSDQVVVIRHTESKGTRAAINACAAVATGDYFCKLDGHCIVAPEFDKTMLRYCDDKTVLVPRRRRLDAERWCEEFTSRPPIDYEFMSWNWPDFGGWTHNIKQWEEKNRNEELRFKLIDEAMCFQASCWMLHRDYFSYLELMDESTYGKLMNEGEEICFKAWLSGGRVLVNKATSYCHLYKGKRYGRGYDMDMEEVRKGAEGVRKWLTNSAWHKQTLPFEWLVEKFDPPGWPDSWREVIKGDS